MSEKVNLIFSIQDYQYSDGYLYGALILMSRCLYENSMFGQARLDRNSSPVMLITDPSPLFMFYREVCNHRAGDVTVYECPDGLFAVEHGGHKIANLGADYREWFGGLEYGTAAYYEQLKAWVDGWNGERSYEYFVE